MTSFDSAQLPSSGSEQAPLHPRLQLDEAIHQPVRLAILATLAHVDKVDFAFLRHNLQLKDANLSRHLTDLESRGYVIIEKVFERKKGRTWVKLSPAGRQAFERHVRLLRQIIETSVEVPNEEGTSPS